MPESWTYGMGYYLPKALTMAKLRARLDRDPGPFEALVRALNRQDRYRLDGEDYKRPKGESTPLLAPWYNKKNFSILRAEPHGTVIFSHDLEDELLEGYELLLPLYRYLIALDGDPDPREPLR